MFKEKREKEKRSSTSAKYIGENKTALQDEGAASKRSSHEHKGVDNAMGSSNPCGV